MIQKKRGPGRPQGSKNKVTAKKAVAPVLKADVKDELIAEMTDHIHDLLVIIAYLEEKLEAKR